MHVFIKTILALFAVFPLWIYIYSIYTDPMIESKWLLTLILSLVSVGFLIFYFSIKSESKPFGLKNNKVVLFAGLISLICTLIRIITEVLTY